jgi:hypothetical protein
MAEGLILLMCWQEQRVSEFVGISEVTQVRRVAAVTGLVTVAGRN